MQSQNENRAEPSTGHPAEQSSCLLWQLLALGIFVPLVARFWFLCDDAYISFRYGRNLAQGLGLAWNPGEPSPVEGYSEFGWVLISALIQALGAPVETIAPWISALCGAALVMSVTHLISRHLVSHPVARLGGVLFVAAAVPLAVWSTGGMGSMAALLCLWLMYSRLLTNVDIHDGWGAGLGGVGLVLLRADGHLWVFLLAGSALVLARLRKDPCLMKAARLAAGLPLLAFLALTAFRLDYHGDWLPNTARAKIGLSPFVIERGARYVGHAFLTYPGLLLALALPLIMGRRTLERPSFVALLVFAAAPAYALLVGGDFMCFHRFLLPLWPFGAVLLAKGLQALAEDSPKRAHVALTLALLIPASNLIPAWDLHVLPQSLRERCFFRFNATSANGAILFRTEREQWLDMTARARQWKRLGEAVADNTAADASLVAGAIGALGWASKRTVFDQFGLTRRDVGDFPQVPGRRSPGHYRYAPASYFAPESPTYARVSIIDELSLRQRGTPPSHVTVLDLDQERYGPGQFLILERYPRP